MAVRSVVGRSRSIVATVGEPITPQVTRVSGAAAGGTISGLTDVNTAQLADGSVLVYNQNTQLWETINTLEKQILNGGTF